MIVESKTYGKYKLSKIAKIRFLPEMNKDASEDERWQRIWEVTEWMDKYHPSKFFGSYSLKSTRPDLPKHAEIGEETQEHHPYILYLPLRQENKRWYYENPDCEYVQYLYKKYLSSRALPIAVTSAKLNKWLIKAQEIGLLIETYYLTF